MSACGGLLGFSEDPVVDTPSGPAGDAAAESANDGAAAEGSTTNVDEDAGDGGGGPAPLRVFVTSTRYAGSNLDFDFAARCQKIADAKSLGGTWRPWLSDSLRRVESAITGAGPWETLNGDRIANDRSELFSGKIRHAIDVDENKATSVLTEVWTGTSADGRAIPGGHCFGWTATDGKGEIGSTGFSNSGWTDLMQQATCVATYPIYCFEIR